MIRTLLGILLIPNLFLAQDKLIVEVKGETVEISTFTNGFFGGYESSNKFVIDNTEVKKIHGLIKKYEENYTGIIFSNINYTPLMKGADCALDNSSYELKKLRKGSSKISKDEIFTIEDSRCLTPLVKLKEKKHIIRFSMLLAGMFKDNSLVINEPKSNVDFDKMIEDSKKKKD